MRKVFGLLMCLVIVPMLFATEETHAVYNTFSDAVSAGHGHVIPATPWDFTTDQTEDSLYYWTSDPTANAIGFNSAAVWQGAIRFTPTELNPYNGDSIIAIIWYHYDGSSPNGRVIVYGNGTASTPGDTLATEPYSGAATGWVRVDFTTGAYIDASGDMWAAVELNDPGSGFYPLGIDAGPAIDGKGDWIWEASLGWDELQNYGLDYNWSNIAIVVAGGGGPTHDVACTGISAPPTQVMPGSSHDPEATYRNNGSGVEVFDVYFDIDSAGTNVYTQTANITLGSGVDTTITFATWTAGGTDGLTYDCIAYTVLSGDENPANDTSTQQTVTNSTYWEILDPPVLPHASSGHSMATVNDGYVWAMRMHPSGSYLPDCDRYDIANNTWDASFTSDPYGAGSYGTANGVNGKIYCIGGTVSWPTGQNHVHIYDPASDSWAEGATAPALLLDHAASVYDDRYIITFGNGNWSMTPTNEVYVYDTENDSWATGTSFPGTARGAAAFGIVDTFAVGACGYRADGVYGDDYIVGIIDPTDPATITWGSWASTGMAGRYRVPSVQDPWNECVWVINGQNGPFDGTWSYDPYTDTWTDWGQPKPQPIGNVTPLAVAVTTANDVGVYAAGGYTGSYVDDNEVFHTGYVPGVNETPGEVATANIGFAPSMNPVKDHVTISYTIDKPANVTLSVYDHSGRLVRTLVNNRSEAQGTRTVYWNAKDDAGRSVANGVYFFTLEAAGQTATHKVTLVK